MPQTEEQKAEAKARRAELEAQRAQLEARKRALANTQRAVGFRRYRAWGASEDRLRALVPKALDVLGAALGNTEDPKLAVTTAVAVLRAAGCYALGRVERPYDVRFTGESDLDREADIDLYLGAPDAALLPSGPDGDD